MELKYNYVIYNLYIDYLWSLFKGLENDSRIKLYKQAFEAPYFVEKAFFIAWSNKVNRVINIPFKKLWFPKMFDIKFNNNKPTSYVFLDAKYISEEPNVYRYIKHLNPENRCIIYFTDLISKRAVDIERLKKSSDFIITYDKREAELYEVNHFDNMCYGAICDITMPREYEYDVYFLGYAKDRLDHIYNVFYYLKENGFKCLFILCGVEKENRITEYGIQYSPPISYIENIKNVQKSKCILEIIQGGSSSPTLRVPEAQIYKRKLLTNNMELKSNPAFDKANMSVFKNVEDIDIDFIKRGIDYSSFNTKRYDTSHRIEFLDGL